jgi:hypothetical protein
VSATLPVQYRSVLAGTVLLFFTGTLNSLSFLQETKVMVNIELINAYNKKFFFILIFFYWLKMGKAVADAVLHCGVLIKFGEILFQPAVGCSIKEAGVTSLPCYSNCALVTVTKLLQIW